MRTMREKTRQAQRNLIMKRAIDALATSVQSIEDDDDVINKAAIIRKQFGDCSSWLKKSFAEAARGDEADDEDRQNEVDEDEGEGDADPDKGRGDTTFRGLGDDRKKEKKAMDWQNIVKDHGFETVVKMIATDKDSHGLDEHMLTQLATEHACKIYKDKRPDAAFAALYSGSIDLRKAMQIAKMPFTVDFQPRVFSQDEAEVHIGETINAAIESLKEIGRRRWPTASEAQQFARAMTDPANAELAAKAHRRPTGHPSYPPPTERERVRG
jgi:hypothetical protein